MSAIRSPGGAGGAGGGGMGSPRTPGSASAAALSANATSLLRRASSLKERLKEAAAEGREKGAAAAAALLLPPRAGGAGRAPKDNLLEDKERRALMENMKAMLVHLRVRSAAAKRAGEPAPQLFAPGPAPATRLADARAVVAIADKEGAARLAETLHLFAPATLAGVVKLAFQSSDAPLLPVHVCGEVVFLHQQAAAEKREMDVDQLRDALGKASARAIDYLGQICALLAVDPTPPSALSYQWGPLLFLPRFDHKTAVSKEYEGMDILKATPSVVAATKFMIEKVVDVFYLDDEADIERRVDELQRRLVASNSSSDLARSLLCSSGAAGAAGAAGASGRGGGAGGVFGAGAAGARASSSQRMGGAQPQKYRAVYAFVAEAPGEICLAEGELILVFDKAEDGWWTGLNEAGQEGLFPGSYAEPVDEGDAAEGGDAGAQPLQDEADAAAGAGGGDDDAEENAAASSPSAGARPARAAAKRGGGGAKAAEADGEPSDLERQLQEEREARRRAEALLQSLMHAKEGADVGAAGAAGVGSGKGKGLAGAGAAANENTHAPQSPPRPAPSGNNMNALAAALAARQAKMGA